MEKNLSKLAGRWQELKTVSIKKTKLRMDISLESIEKTLALTLEAHATVVVWARQAIFWGTWDGAHITFKGNGPRAEAILECRAFSDTAEVHLRREGASLVGRALHEGEGESVSFVDSFARLWGSLASEGEGFMRLEDRERKLALELPMIEHAAGDEYFGLLTRNYIEADAETGLAGFGDYRLVAVLPAQGGE